MGWAGLARAVPTFASCGSGVQRQWSWQQWAEGVAACADARRRRVNIIAGGGADEYLQQLARAFDVLLTRRLEDRISIRLQHPAVGWAALASIVCTCRQRSW
eukprot:1910756-Prymnesium_polylepis.2